MNEVYKIASGSSKPLCASFKANVRHSFQMISSIFKLLKGGRIDWWMYLSNKFGVNGLHTWDQSTLNYNKFHWNLGKEI